MPDRIDLIARLGAAIEHADATTSALLREALSVLVEDHGLLAATERRRAKDRTRKRPTHSVDSAESAESAENGGIRGIDGPPPPAPSPSFPTPHITPSSPPTPASSSSSPRTVDEIEAETRLFDRTAIAAGGRSRAVIARFLSFADGAQRTAWVGRLGALLDRPPHFTAEELVEGIEALMTEPREMWKPSVLKAWVRRVRSDATREAERERAPAAIRVMRPGEAGDDAGAVFAKLRELIQTAPAVPGQQRRRFIKRADVEALGEAVLAAYDRVGGSDRFLDTNEQVGFVLRDFTREYRALARAPTETGIPA